MRRPNIAALRSAQQVRSDVGTGSLTWVASADVLVGVEAHIGWWFGLLGGFGFIVKIRCSQRLLSRFCEWARGVSEVVKGSSRVGLRVDGRGR